MAGRTAVRRDEVMARHRAGDLDAARAGYERLLAAAPDDPDLLGLLGVVAMQQGRADEAAALLRRALAAAAPDARVHLRNLNNLFAHFRAEGRDAEAAELARAPVPDWPADRPPDAAELDRAMSLAEALALAGQPGRGAALMDSVLAHPGAGLEASLLAGRLWEAADAFAAALPHLKRAAALDAGDWRVQTALSVAHGGLGEVAEATAAARRAAMAAPVYLAPARAGQRATILVLNATPQIISVAHENLHHLHFFANFIAQASIRLRDEYRFASVFAELPGPPPALPRADLVFNNLASGEALARAGGIEGPQALIAQCGRPVVNPPEAVLAMTRQKGAALLQGIPGLRVPRIERYRRDMARIDEIVADVAARFSYPVILRYPGADSSAKWHNTAHATAIRVADADELRAALARVPWPQVYVIQYVDLRKPDGTYRKLRAAFLGDQIIVSRCQFGLDWLVGAAATAQVYQRFPDLALESQRILAAPEATLGPKLMPVLQAVRERVPLDLFGLDFDVDPDGNLVMFEAQATMSLLPGRQSPDRAIAPKEPGRRIMAAFHRLVADKLAGATPPAAAPHATLPQVRSP